MYRIVAKCRYCIYQEKTHCLCGGSITYYHTDEYESASTWTTNKDAASVFTFDKAKQVIKALPLNEDEWDRWSIEVQLVFTPIFIGQNICITSDAN